MVVRSTAACKLGLKRRSGLQAALEDSQREAAHAAEALASLTAQVGARLAADEQVTWTTAHEHSPAWSQSEHQKLGSEHTIAGIAASKHS